METPTAEIIEEKSGWCESTTYLFLRMGENHVFSESFWRVVDRAEFKR